MTVADPRKRRTPPKRDTQRDDETWAEEPDVFDVTDYDRMPDHVESDLHDGPPVRLDSRRRWKKKSMRLEIRALGRIMAYVTIFSTVYFLGMSIFAGMGSGTRDLAALAVAGLLVYAVKDFSESMAMWSAFISIAALFVKSMMGILGHSEIGTEWKVLVICGFATALLLPFAILSQFDTNKCRRCRTPLGPDHVKDPDIPSLYKCPKCGLEQDFFSDDTFS